MGWRLRDASLDLRYGNDDFADPQVGVDRCVDVQDHFVLPLIEDRRQDVAADLEAAVDERDVEGAAQFDGVAFDQVFDQVINDRHEPGPPVMIRWPWVRAAGARADLSYARPDTRRTDLSCDHIDWCKSSPPR